MKNIKVRRQFIQLENIFVNQIIKSAFKLISQTTMYKNKPGT